MNPATSRLRDFLVLEKNSVSREHILTTRLKHDLATAAAVRGYDLAIYVPEVDRDGFDMIVDDRDTLMPLQLKSFAGSTSKWHVHRRLLRPKRHYVEAYGFELSPRGDGLAGGIVVIDIAHTETTIAPEYLYCDINILTAFALNVIKRPPAQQKAIENARNALSADASGKVTITKSAFLRARSPEHLLALAGLNSRFHGAWPSQLFALSQQEFAGKPLSAPRDVIVGNVRSHLQQLCLDKLAW